MPRTETQKEEMFLIGEMLRANETIELIAASVSAEEFGTHTGLMFDALCRAWARDPKRKLTPEYFLYEYQGEDPEGSKAMRALAKQAVEFVTYQGGNGEPLTIERAISAIHNARRQDKLALLFADLEKRKDTLATEAAAATVAEMLDVIRKGIRFPQFTSLTKRMTDPPEYDLGVHMAGERRTLRLTSKQLLDPKAIEHKIWEHFDTFAHYIPNAAGWQLRLTSLSKVMEKQAVDSDNPTKMVAVQKNELADRVVEFLDKAKRVHKLSEMCARTMYLDQEQGHEALDFNDLQNHIRSTGGRPADGRLADILHDLKFEIHRFGATRKRLWMRRLELL